MPCEPHTVLSFFPALFDGINIKIQIESPLNIALIEGVGLLPGCGLYTRII